MLAKYHQPGSYSYREIDQYAKTEPKSLSTPDVHAGPHTDMHADARGKA